MKCPLLLDLQNQTLKTFIKIWLTAFKLEAIFLLKSTKIAPKVKGQGQMSPKFNYFYGHRDIYS